MSRVEASLPPSGLGHLAGRRLPPAVATWLLVAGFVMLWHLAVSAGWVDRLSVAAPRDSLTRLLLIAGGETFWMDLAVTGRTTVVAFAAAGAVGLPLGAVLARAPAAHRILEPYLVGAYAVPVVVFYPTFLVIFGIGSEAIILTAFLMAVVPVILATTVAISGIRPTMQKLPKTLGCSRLGAFRIVYFPAALPMLLPGFKLAFVYSMAATVGVEFIVADAGLGFRIAAAYRNFETVDMYAHIIAMIVVAALVNLAFNALERTMRSDLL